MREVANIALIKIITFFFIYKEIQTGAVAKSYTRKVFQYMREMRKYLVIYDFATALI